MKLAVLLAGLLPAGIIKNRILRLLGHSVHDSARIHPCIMLGVSRVSIGAQTRIGALTVFRDLAEVRLDEYARVGQLNWISAAKDLRFGDKSARLVVGEHSAITNRHYLDCSGGVEIGQFSTVAGVRSTFITHGINWKDSVQSLAPIRIGSHCIVSSNVNVSPGTILADYSVIGMGATVDKSLASEGGLIVSTRGQLVKPDLTGKYFSRVSGVVPSPHLDEETNRFDYR